MGKADTERLSPWKRQSICMRLHKRSLFLNVLRENVVMVVIVVSSKKNELQALMTAARHIA
jgi:hypothetical protein